MDLPVSLDLFSSLTRALDGVLVAVLRALRTDVGELERLLPAPLLAPVALLTKVG